MAAYCRVSTGFEEQLQSYEMQCRYYSESIRSNPGYEFAGIYADEGISGTGTKKRAEFNRMIGDCRAGRIDRIVTKSISRFARNTLDCLNYVRELRSLGIGITFEKESIDTLDAKGEVLLTILSSLAQDESRSISENSAWGIRKRYEAGRYSIATARFLGYDRDADGRLVVNKAQAGTVERIYGAFMDGNTPGMVAHILEAEGIANWDGSASSWDPGTIGSILRNEKYKGDAILQKSYSTDFLTKRRRRNTGELPVVHIREDHEPIIDAGTWEAVQEEWERREGYCAAHGTRNYSHRPDTNPFGGRIICGLCGRAYVRKGWTGSRRTDHIWQCTDRYRSKGVIGCRSGIVHEDEITQVFSGAWGMRLKDGAGTGPEADTALGRYRQRQFAALIAEGSVPPVQAVLDRIEILGGGRFAVYFLDGTSYEINVKKG